MTAPCSSAPLLTGLGQLDKRGKLGGRNRHHPLVLAPDPKTRRGPLLVLAPLALHERFEHLDGVPVSDRHAAAVLVEHVHVPDVLASAGTHDQHRLTHGNAEAARSARSTIFCAST